VVVEDHAECLPHPPVAIGVVAHNMQHADPAEQPLVLLDHCVGA
jgi:hypothetical protein